jgi:hypothetical protein
MKKMPGTVEAFQAGFTKLPLAIHNRVRNEKASAGFMSCCTNKMGYARS